MNNNRGRCLIFILSLVFLLSCTVPAGAATAGAMQPALQWQIGQVLTNDFVSLLLLIIGISGLIIGVAAVGGFGLFGSAGLAAFALYFLGNLWVGSMSFAALWLLLGGLVLIALEIFFVPGFGAPGALGIVSILAALVVAAENPVTALWQLVLALAVSGAIVWFTLKHKQTRQIWRKMILFNKLDGESGFDSADKSLARFAGLQGRALSVLRPAGSAEIAGEKVDVVTQGEYIPAGSKIVVVMVEGMRVVVKEDKKDNQEEVNS